MVSKIKYKGFVYLFVLMVNLSFSQSLEKTANNKISQLDQLIYTIEAQGKDALKERMTVRTAEEFLKYAQWDESHKAENESYFKQFSIYKNNAKSMAEALPDFERNDIIKMLDNAILYAEKLRDGKVIRQPIPNIDWTKVKVESNQITCNNRPVFLADFTWKPDSKQLQEFYGDLDVAFISPSFVDASGNVDENFLQKLYAESSNTPGFVFINNKNVPEWTNKKYGATFNRMQGAPFLEYDIDNPGAKELMGNLIKGTVPKMAGKQYTNLGYMLCNEPRWITYKNGSKKVWSSQSVSAFTIEKFKKWLQTKHQSIAQLNALWHTNFKNFDAITVEIPMDISLLGTPKWYDWNTFNDYRVTQWFTWMKSEIRKYDPSAKAQLKIMPSFFTNNDPCTGIDLEALTELSEINGNDVAANYNYTRSGEIVLDQKYAFGWRELFMGYDFLKSVRPNQLNFNSESHLLSTNHSRDLYMDPAYVRAVHWAAHILGLNASQTWYWPRDIDGSLRKKVTKGYAGSNNQQPQVTNELFSTIMDLNSYSEEIVKMQNARKPIRLFYSKTSAANKASYMDGIFEAYEALNFEGIPLGFATKNILLEQNSNLWDVVLVYNTEHVTQEELNALQQYLDEGGTIITDAISLKRNEYGLPLERLKQSKGTLLIVSTLDRTKASVLAQVKNKSGLPEISVTETNANGYKGCMWRYTTNDAGNYVLSIINLGKTDTNIAIKLKGAEHEVYCKDLLNGIEVSLQPVLKPYEVYFVELSEKK